MANSGMPVNMKFNSKYFVRPPKPIQEGKAFMFSLDRASTGINNTPQNEPTIMTVIEKIIDGFLNCEVRNPENS